MTRSILCGNVCSALAQYSFSPAHLFARPAQYPQQQFTRLSVCKDWSSYCNSGGSAASLVGNDIIICGGFFWLPVFFLSNFFQMHTSVIYDICSHLKGWYGLYINLIIMNIIIIIISSITHCMKQGFFFQFCYHDTLASLHPQKQILFLNWKIMLYVQSTVHFVIQQVNTRTQKKTQKK